MTSRSAYPAEAARGGRRSGEDQRGLMVASPEPQRQDVDELTEREADVLHLLVLGLSYSEISRALHVSINTVKSHVRHVYDKLGVTRRADAVRAAYGSEVIRQDGTVSLRLRLPQTSVLTSITFSQTQPVPAVCDVCGAGMERIIESTYRFGAGTGRFRGSPGARAGGWPGDGGE